jgi:hypothetical protein
MADTADRILNDLRRRRDELKPLVGELERIEAAIGALESAETGSGTGRANGSPAAKAPNGRRRRRGRPRGSGRGAGGSGGGGAPAGPNRTDQFLNLVRRGAISIPAAARELGIGPNYLYRIAATLESEGTIRKQGREYVMNVDSTPSENAEVLPERGESRNESAPPGRDEGDDDDLIADEGVNEGTREIVEE